MIRTFNGKTPQISDSAFVSERAYVVGDVEIGDNSGVWPGAVIRADFGTIKVGANTQIEDNSVLHSGASMNIGDNVIIGHNAVVHGLAVGNNVLIGNNATILDFTEIGDNCIIGANALVPAGRRIPANSYVIGAPARIKKELSEEERRAIRGKVTEKYKSLRSRNAEQLNYAALVRKYKEEGL